VENLRQAVTTTLDAGLVALVVPSSAADWDTLSESIPGDLLVHAGTLSAGLEAVARLGRAEGPLTGGDGI
jgi:hypothetical protein